MDAFAFDRRFARYMAQMDTRAIARGTELYEGGHARLDRAEASGFEGSVTDGRSGIYRVTLRANEEGGLSGGCDCEEFFNCRHSYALARAARDRIMQKERQAQPKAPPKVAKSPPSGFEARAGGQLDAPQSRLVQELVRLWKLGQRCGFLFYPRDLRFLSEDNRPVGPVATEPLRDLKRLLGARPPRSALELADALKGYCMGKGQAMHPVFSALAVAPEAPSVAEAVQTGGSMEWDRPPIPLHCRFRLEPTADRDWFQVSAEWDFSSSGLDEAEGKQLLAAKGELTRVPGKGWLRMDTAPSPEVAALLRSLGLSVDRGNRQRIHASQIEELLPESMTETGGWTQALRRARKVQETAYEAPETLRDTLRPYQAEGFRFLCRLTDLGLGGILADDMGLGKTLQTLAWLVWQAERLGPDRKLRALVVCPKSVTSNWVQETVKFGTGLSATAFRPDLVDSSTLAEANLVVANYAQLRLNADYFQATRWDVAILDEAQYIKSPDSQTTKVAYSLQADQRLALTGTPIENSLMDLWSLMRFAMPRLLGPQAAFRLNYDAAKDAQALDGLRKRIRPFMLRRLKSEVAKDLPSRIEEDIHCELEGAQLALYEREMEAARAALREIRSEGDFQRQRFNVLQALLRIRQICCDPRLVDPDWISEEPSAKLTALLDIVLPLVEEGHKILVFSQFVRMLELVEKSLLDQGVPCLVLTGKTQNRGELVDRFQGAKSEKVFLLSLKAAGSGLNLTAASYVALFDPWWNPAVEAQAIDRTHRIGQTSQVIAYRLMAKDTIEQKIRQIQSEKADLARSIIGEESLGAALDLSDLKRLLL